MAHLLDIFQKKQLIDSLLKGSTDIHSHILPHVDDGCKDEETAIYLLSSLEKKGIQKIFLTPHIKANFQENTPITLKKSFENFSINNPTKIEIRLAAEYMLDEFFYEHLNKHKLLTFDGKHVLVEMSYLYSPINLHEMIYDVFLKGYIPILAHPERYLYLTSKDYKHLKSVGCKFQMNLFSLIGYYGKEVKNLSMKLLEDNFYDFVGSDIHKKRDLDFYQNFQISKKTAEQLSYLLNNNESLFT